MGRDADAKIWSLGPLVSAARSRLRRLQYRLRRPTLRPGPATIASAFRHPIDHANRTALAARYRERFPEGVRATLDEAQRLLDHHFRLLGHSIHYGREIAWSRDPVSGRDWSRGFSLTIPYRGADRLGDVKLPWELNKHQYFFTLGKAAWLTDQPIFAREIVTQIDHWIRDNPSYSGIHWVSALESGARVLSWILTYPFYRDVCDDAFLGRMTESLTQHTLFVERHLSVGPFANTHFVGEAATLVVSALFLDCCHSKRWLEKGLRSLEVEITKQVRADGSHVEQSIAYHRFFLDHYYLVDALLRANGRSFSVLTLQRMESSTEFLMNLRFPDGSVPAFGDCDDARAIWCGSEAPRNYSSLLTLGALLFHRGDFKSIARRASEELLWLYGEAALASFDELPAQAPTHTSWAYPDAGYYVMRGGWNVGDPVLAFDCGPLGHGPSGHGHADALSFQLHALNYPFLVDSGTYSYNLDYRWRNIFRSTRAHNSVVIDGLDQSVIKDRMSWSFMATARCRQWISTEEFDLVDSEHDGYRRLSDPVSHRRVLIFLKPDIWLVYDLLTGIAPHEAEVLFHVRPECAITLSHDLSSAVLTAPGRQQLNVRPVECGDISTRLETLDGSDESAPIAFSEEYGQKVPCSAIRFLLPFCGARASLIALSPRVDIVVSSACTVSAIDVTFVGADQKKHKFSYRVSAEKQKPILTPI
jgi:uncharacterized heparinase superfamily protein